MKTEATADYSMNWWSMKLPANVLSECPMPVFLINYCTKNTHCVGKVIQSHKSKYSHPCPPTKEVSCYFILAFIVGQKLEIKIAPETKTVFMVDGAKPTP